MVPGSAVHAGGKGSYPVVLRVIPFLVFHDWNERRFEMVVMMEKG